MLVARLSPEAKLLVTLLREQILWLHAQLERLQKMLFGRRSEKIPPIEKVLRDEEIPEKTVDGTPMPTEDKEKKELRRHRRKKSEAQRKNNRERQKGCQFSNTSSMLKTNSCCPE